MPLSLTKGQRISLEQVDPELLEVFVGSNRGLFNQNGIDHGGTLP